MITNALLTSTAVMNIGRLDIELFQLVNGCCANPVLYFIMNSATMLGAGVVQSGLSLFLILLGLLRNNTSLRKAGYAGFTAFALSGIAVSIAKMIWDRPRPPLVVAEIELADVSRFGHSFPSGHTTTAFAVAVAMAIYLPKFRLPILLLAAAAGISRIYLGVHFPLDVIFGAAIGLIVGGISANFFRDKKADIEVEITGEVPQKEIITV